MALRVHVTIDDQKPRVLEIHTRNFVYAYRHHHITPCSVKVNVKSERIRYRSCPFASESLLRSTICRVKAIEMDETIGGQAGPFTCELNTLGQATHDVLLHSLSCRTLHTGRRGSLQSPSAQRYPPYIRARLTRGDPPLSHRAL